MNGNQVIELENKIKRLSLICKEIKELRKDIDRIGNTSKIIAYNENEFSGVTIPEHMTNALKSEFKRLAEERINDLAKELEELN